MGYGVDAAEMVVGSLVFEASFEYADEASWAREQHLHLVPPGHAVFGWKEGVPKWGWRVAPGSARVFEPPLPVPALLRVERSVFALGRPLAAATIEPAAAGMCSSGHA